jgi:Zn finger protein HypA/HybF involved in hydrogenase expression
MKTIVASEIVGTYADGSQMILPRHEVEVLCIECLDPVSAMEETTGVCTSCGKPWTASQSVAVHVTSTPLSGTVRI